MSPPKLQDVLKTLEYFGIYQRFECIKCHQNLATINLALAHLRGEYLECKNVVDERSSLPAKGKKVIASKTPNRENSSKKEKKRSPLLPSDMRKKKHLRSKYSLKQIEMILNKKKKDNVFAKQFGITTRDVAKLRYTWKKHKQYKNLLLKVVEKKDIVALKAASVAHTRPKHVTSKVTSKKPTTHPYKINKSAKGSQDYKVESAEEVPQ